MCREDAEAVRGAGVVLAINNTVALAPFVDVLYSADFEWWRRCAPAWFAGRRVGLAHDALPAGVEGIEHRAAAGLGRDRVHTGNNSGYQAINFAFLQGARRIVLLGYDMQHSGGRRHWHADHPVPLGNFGPGMPELCRPKFAGLARDLREEGIEVINASRATALDCFNRQPLAEILGR